MANEEKALWSQEELNRAWQEYLNREAFSYDYTKDPTYQHYRNRYTAEGQRAMEDTVGVVTSLTGGYGNSYAQTAGQQSYRQYLQRLNDVIPELYDNAYRRYQAEGEALYDEIVLRQQQQEKELAAQSGSSGGNTGGSSGGSGGGYNNSGYGKAVVMAAQKAVGATEDGLWGPESSAKAAAYGFHSLKDVVNNGIHVSYDYVKKAMKKQLGHDRGVASEMDFLVARNNDGGPEIYLQYKNYQEYLMDVLRQIYA